MKIVSYLMLLGGAFATCVGLQAQDNRYIDDAYMTKADVKAKQENARAKAEAERLAYEARMKQQREERAKWEAEMLKAQRSREIDAYNGRLSTEDSLVLAEYHRRKALDTGEEISRDGYGEYSRRLRRFYSDGSIVVINNPYNVYMDDDSWYTGGRYYSSFRWGYYDPWYSDFYYPAYRRAWSWDYYPSSWYYDAWVGSRYAYYDPWYGGYAYGSYWGGYYPYSWYGYPRYYSVPVVYRDNTYRHAARSSSNPTSYGGYNTSYGAYQSARSQIDRGVSPNYGTGYRGYDGASSVGSSYRGVGRSAYGTGSGSYNSRSQVDRDQGRAVYSQPQVNSNSGSNYSAPARSYGGGSSSGARGRR